MRLHLHILRVCSSNNSAGSIRSSIRQALMWSIRKNTFRIIGSCATFTAASIHTAGALDFPSPASITLVVSLLKRSSSYSNRNPRPGRFQIELGQVCSIELVVVGPSVRHDWYMLGHDKLTILIEIHWLWLSGESRQVLSDSLITIIVG